VLVISLVINFTAFGYFFEDAPKFRVYQASNTFTAIENREISKTEIRDRLKQKALLAKKYVNDHGYAGTHCFLLDMRLPSGKNRFFVYNLEDDSVEMAGLVTHGKGSENGSDELVFSNTPNSNCTSLGKYKIGRSYNGIFGLSYKLSGLDKTNDKAFDRFVVLHSYTGVPKNEVYPESICVSEGCPTVSPEFLAQLKTYMERSQEPILLWIYY
jgi:hypothetical protein